MAELLRHKACKEKSCRYIVARDRPAIKLFNSVNIRIYIFLVLLAHLHVYHVAHGDSDLHPGPLDIVEVEVMKNCQAEGANRQSGGIAESGVKGIMISRVVALKVQNQLAQEDWLHHFNDFLKRRTSRDMKRNESHRTTIIV